MTNDTNKLARFFEKRSVLMAISLILSIVIWAMVGFRAGTTFETTVHKVPVILSINNTAFQNLGLEITDRSVIYVDVRVTGPRAEVGALTPESIQVVPNYSRVNQAGTFTLPLNYTIVDPMATYSVVAIEPGSVQLSFEESLATRFTVESDVTGVKAAEGFILENVTVTPGEVRISGPQSEVERIDRVVVHYHEDVTLRDTKTISDVPLTLYDREGNELSQNLLNFDYDTVDLQIPIYKLGMLPLKIEFSNVPDGFDVSTLDYVMSVEEIEVAGSAATIDNLQPRTIGIIDLTTINIGESYEIEIQLPSGLINRGPETVTVTFRSGNLATKRVNVTDIRLLNVPANYSVTVRTVRINDVTVIGNSADVEALLPGSVVATIDLSKLHLEPGDHAVPVTFVITSNNTTWVTGSYTVIIHVESA